MNIFIPSIRFAAWIAGVSAFFWLVGDSALAQHGHHGGTHGGGHGSHGYGGHGYAGHGYAGHGYGGHGYGGLGHGGHGYGGLGYGGHGYGGHGYGGHGLGHLGHGIGHQLGHAIGHGALHHGTHGGLDHHLHAGGHYDTVQGLYGGGYYSHPHIGSYTTPYYSGYGYSSALALPYYGYYNPAPLGVVSPALVETDLTTLPGAYTAAKPVIPEIPTASTAVTASNRVEANEYRTRAEQAFRNSAFDEAARLAGHAMVESPEDGRLKLLYAQTLFAIGDYDGAAGAIHHAASLLEPEDWGHVVESYANYYRGNGFVDQMRRLESFLEADPDNAAARFLRGYQYGFLGHPEVAIGELNRVLELESRDQLAAELVTRFGGTPMVVPAVESPASGESRDEPIQIDSPPPPLPMDNDA